MGNRPQFIKSGPLSVALREAKIDEIVVHTGQHYDRELSGVFFEELGLAEPAYRLEAHTRDVAAMQPGIAGAVSREQPDGSPCSATELTLRCASCQGPVPGSRIEAGMRSRDLTMPGASATGAWPAVCSSARTNARARYRGRRRNGPPSSSAT